jgi:hypothetical protein
MTWVHSAEELRKLVAQWGAQIRDIKPLSAICLVSFDGMDIHAMKTILDLLNSSEFIDYAEPDYIGRALEQ